MPIDVIVTLLALGLGIVVVASRRKRFAGTTLVAPARWTVFALTSIFMLTVYGWMVAATPSTLNALRYLVATTTFCPLMAVLGAKRPQNLGWQWIVATLWIVLILPVGEMFLLWKGGALDISAARRWLLVILMFVGLTNYALTKFSFAALVSTFGQGFLLLPHLPIVGRDSPSGQLIGSLLITASIGIAWAQTRRVETNGGWNLVWTEFRNAFGLVWGLRVMERVNSTAKLCNWSNELTWFGFSEQEGENSSAQEKEREEVERAMRTSLRRFVSSDWIEERYN